MSASSNNGNLLHDSDFSFGTMKRGWSCSPSIDQVTTQYEQAAGDVAAECVVIYPSPDQAVELTQAVRVKKDYWYRLELDLSFVTALHTDGCCIVTVRDKDDPGRIGARRVVRAADPSTWCRVRLEFDGEYVWPDAIVHIACTGSGGETALLYDGAARGSVPSQAHTTTPRSKPTEPAGVRLRRARLCTIDPPPTEAHPWALPTVRRPHPGRGVPKSLAIVGDVPQQCPLTDMLEQVLPAMKVRRYKADEFDPAKVREQAVLIAGVDNEQCNWSFDALLTVGRSRMVLVDLRVCAGALKSLTDKPLRVSTLKQNTIAPHGIIEWANFVAAGYALHDAVPLYWQRGDDEYRARYLKLTSPIKKLLKAHDIVPLVLSEAEDDAGTDHAMVLSREAEGGAVVACDMDALCQPADPSGAWRVWAGLVLNCLVPGILTESQYQYPPFNKADIDEQFDRLPRRFTNLIEHTGLAGDGAEIRTYALAHADQPGAAIRCVVDTSPEQIAGAYMAAMLLKRAAQCCREEVRETVDFLREYSLELMLDGISGAGSEQEYIYSPIKSHHPAPAAVIRIIMTKPGEPVRLHVPAGTSTSKVQALLDAFGLYSGYAPLPKPGGWRTGDCVEIVTGRDSSGGRGFLLEVPDAPERLCCSSVYITEYVVRVLRSVVAVCAGGDIFGQARVR